MEDLARLLTLLKYISEQGEQSGLDMLYKLVVNREPFDVCNDDIEAARDLANTTLESLFAIEEKRGILYGRQKVSMKNLFGNLAVLLERMDNIREESGVGFSN